MLILSLRTLKIFLRKADAFTSGSSDQLKNMKMTQYMKIKRYRIEIFECVLDDNKT